MNTHNFPLAQWADKKAGRWIAFWLVLAIVLLLVGCDDNGFEQALADEMEQVQRWEIRKADRVAKQISDCIAERGPGAVPVFDEQGFVVRCVQRRKS